MHTGYRMGQAVRAPGDFQVDGDLEVKGQITLSNDFPDEVNLSLSDSSLVVDGGISAGQGKFAVSPEGDLTVNTKLTVAAATGNTAVAGTLTVQSTASMARVVPYNFRSHMCLGHHEDRDADEATDIDVAVGGDNGEHIQEFDLAAGDDSYDYRVGLQTDTSPPEGAVFYFVVRLPQAAGRQFIVKRGHASSGTTILTLQSNASEAREYTVAFINRGAASDYWMKLFCVKNDV